MSEGHGEAAMQKPIGECAKYLKILIPPIIPETFQLKPVFKVVASDENIRLGVLAFRDFLYLFFDRLITDGHLYTKPLKTKNPMDYPILANINLLLIDIGYHGILSEKGDALLVREMPSCTVPKPKIPVSRQRECLRFLEGSGFAFQGLDLDAKTLNVSELVVSFPDNPILLTGLKALSIAAKEMWVRFLNNADNLLRCDYRAMCAEEPDVLGVLKDTLHSLPENLQSFALELHQRYVDKGMTSVTLSDNEVHFAYAYVKNGGKPLSTRGIYQKRIWEFGLSMKYGYCLTVRAKKADKYADAIEKFPAYLREKIAQGYGCDRKLRGEPCQGGCQGIRIPLDDRVLEMRRDIEVWLDNETAATLANNV